MANWDKLNSEFDTVIDNISDEDMDDWYLHTEQQKEQYYQHLQYMDNPDNIAVNN